MTGYALGRLGDRRAVRLLLKEAAENNKWIRIRLYELVENMRDKALSELTKALTDTDRPEELALCIEVLGHAKDVVAAPTILQFVNHPSMEVRIKAVKALAEIKYIPALDALMDLLDDEQWEVRALASKALDSFGEVRAIEKLSEKLSDSQWWVRYNAAVALSHLKGAGVRKLANTVRSSPDRFARDIARQALEELAFS
jgi:HEAT repeat protein